MTEEPRHPTAAMFDGWRISYCRQRGRADLNEVMQKAEISRVARENPALVQQLGEWCVEALRAAKSPIVRETVGGAE